MTDEETGRIHDRAGSLRVQIQTMAREMFGHLALLGVPDIGVLLLPDGEHSPIDLLRARESAERQVNRLGREIGELQAEIRTRQKQLAYVSGQKTPIELESLERRRGRVLRPNRQRCFQSGEQGAGTLDRYRS